MLLLQKQAENYHLGVWKVSETKEELLSFLSDWDYREDEGLSNITSNARLMERIAVRVLLFHLLESRNEIAYYESGRPYLKCGDYNISISHTRGYVAVILSKNKYTGIDIQCFSDVIKRVKSKFISDNEYIDKKNELIHLLLHWSAKESLYKALGDGVNLKESFSIETFAPQKEGRLKAVENITGNSIKFNLEYMVEEDFVMAYII